MYKLLRYEDNRYEVVPDGAYVFEEAGGIQRLQSTRREVLMWSFAEKDTGSGQNKPARV